MNHLINPENPVFSFITKVTYSAYLNILWFLCCLPVVTAGASTAALYYVTLKMAKNEEGNLTKSFFHSFRQNFKQGTVIGLILLALGILLGADGYVLYHIHFSNAFWTVITAIFFVAAAAYFIILLYIFPLLARFKNTTAAMFKNSVILGMRFLLCTVLMAAIHVFMAFLIIRIFTPAIIFGEGLCALLSSYLLANILLLCQEQSGDHNREATGQPSGEIR